MISLRRFLEEIYYSFLFFIKKKTHQKNIKIDDKTGNQIFSTRNITEILGNYVSDNI